MTPIDIRPFEAGDSAWVVAEHQRLYTLDEGFDDSFGPFVAQILQEFVATHDPTDECGWIAQGPQGPLGSIFCVRLDAQTAKLRMFLLSQQARGQGLGRRMLQTCMEFARTQGYAQMQLWTHESHKAAGALYARAGWQLVQSTPVHSFGKPNVEQIWTIRL